MSDVKNELSILRDEFRKSIQSCNERFLFSSAKWASELLIGINPQYKKTATSASSSLSKNIPQTISESPVPDKQFDVYLLAQSYFNMKEYQRVYHLIKTRSKPASSSVETSSPIISMASYQHKQHIILHPKLTFIQFYAQFLALDRVRQTKPLEEDINALDKLSSEFNELMEQHPELHEDAFLVYLQGLLFSKRKLEKAALEKLITCINLNPYIWSAWTELNSLIKTSSMLEGILSKIQDSFIKKMFLVHISLELHVSSSVSISDILEELLEIFPSSSSIKSLIGISYYNSREFDDAEQAFDELIQSEPYMIDGMDYYSNVLYVMEKKSKLSSLAHNIADIDPYRPESCCIIGNYYSLKGLHSKAVSYFERALKLNQHYLQAWTLMGHEFLEMKNTPSAIEAYRKATDLNSKDYRAWYGLGQTYEVLRMPYYSLYYFQKATALRPYDSRMWCALAGTYESLKRTTDAIKSYKRALCSSDYEAMILGRLAHLYTELKKHGLAHHYYKLCFQESKALGQAESKEFEDACLFLTHYAKDQGDINMAINYVHEIQHTEEGKALYRDLQSIQGTLFR